MQPIRSSGLNKTPSDNLMVPYRAFDYACPNRFQDAENKRSDLDESLRLWDARARELEDRRDDLFGRMAQILDEYLEELSRLQQENNDLRAFIMNGNSASDSSPVLPPSHIARGSRAHPSDEEDLIPLLTASKA